MSSSEAGRWAEVVEDDGTVFYHNEVTGKSSWTKPEGGAGAAAAVEPEPEEAPRPSLKLKPAPKAVLTLKPAPKLMYRGSNSDTQLTGNTKLAWGNANPLASQPLASPDTRPKTPAGRTWESWATEELLVWLANLDIDTKACIEAFRANRIKGKHLSKLDEAMLEKLGVQAFGDRDSILEARDELVADDGSQVLADAQRRALGDLTTSTAGSADSRPPRCASVPPVTVYRLPLSNACVPTL